MPFEISPFEILLLSSCLLPGQTVFKESKALVKVEPHAGETILFFNIDDKSNDRTQSNSQSFNKKTRRSPSIASFHNTICSNCQQQKSISFSA